MTEPVFSKASPRRVPWSNLKWHNLHTVRTQVCREIRIYRCIKGVLLMGKSVAKTRHAWGPFDAKYPLIPKVRWQPLTHMAFTHVFNVNLRWRGYHHLSPTGSMG